MLNCWMFHPNKHKFPVNSVSLFSNIDFLDFHNPMNILNTSSISILLALISYIPPWTYASMINVIKMKNTFVDMLFSGNDFQKCNDNEVLPSEFNWEKCRVFYYCISFGWIEYVDSRLNKFFLSITSEETNSYYSYSVWIRQHTNITFNNDLKFQTFKDKWYFQCSWWNFNPIDIISPSHRCLSLSLSLYFQILGHGTALQWSQDILFGLNRSPFGHCPRMIWSWKK